MANASVTRHRSNSHENHLLLLPPPPRLVVQYIFSSRVKMLWMMEGRKDDTCSARRLLFPTPPPPLTLTYTPSRCALEEHARRCLLICIVNARPDPMGIAQFSSIFTCCKTWSKSTDKTVPSLSLRQFWQLENKTMSLHVHRAFTILLKTFP